jgi:hypothetical protein
MKLRGWQWKLLGTHRPHFYNFGKNMEILKKVFTLINPTREFGLVTCVGRLVNIINTPNMFNTGWLIVPFLVFLLLNLHFLLFLNLLVTSIKDFTRQGRRKERRPDGRRRKRVNMRLNLLG